jgi:2-oxoglutarate dehydrogenase E2 component (dihydrolipoamide succinyltransferase)
MPTNIIMPQLGESVVDGTVGEWLKQVGDAVQEFEPILRVSTDKVDTEVPAPASGILLAIHVAEGETVNAGVLLGIIGQAGEVAEPITMATPPMSDNGTTPSSDTRPYGGHITPVVARMIAEHNINIALLQGTGREGRITKKDVLDYLEKQAQSSEELPPWERPGSGDLFKPTVEYTLDDTPKKPDTQTITTRPADLKERIAQAKYATREAPLAADPIRVQPDTLPLRPPSLPQIPAQTNPTAPTPSHLPGSLSSNIPGQLVGLTTMRRAIAQHMVQSKYTAPHVTTVFEVDLTNVVKNRALMKEAAVKQGIKLTYTPYFIAAVVSGLQRHPLINSTWTDEGIYLYHALNIGIATALDDGLIVPVVRNAGEYNLLGLARMVNDLADRARKKQLRPDEVRDGTFTITNHGVTGSLFATPIINQPQSAILGIGAIEKRVKVIQDDAIAIRSCAYFSLTFDHRVIDGATADNFMADVKRELENWL